MGLRELGKKLGSDSGKENPPPEKDGRLDLFPFLPPTKELVIPPGWSVVFMSACRRLASAMPPKTWGTSFRVLGASIRDGMLEIETRGGNTAVAGVIRKTRRISGTLCHTCGAPALMFRGSEGLRPHCPRCLAMPLLRRDVQRVLSWETDIQGGGRAALQLRSVPASLRASLATWWEGVDQSEPMQPWHLEDWIRALSKASKTYPLRTRN